jgi:uncharacterized membrane protein YhfC
VFKQWAWALAAALLLSGCAMGSPSEPLQLREAPWQVGETTVYDVLGRDGQRLGEATWTWTQQDGEWVQGYEIVVSGSATAGEVRTDSGLLPISAWREGAGRRSEAVYGADEVKLVSIAPDGTETMREVTARPDMLDNEQTLQTQRALPLTEGYRTAYTNLVPSTGAAVRMNVSVAGREQVTVPAGVFAAWHVEMSAGGVTHEAWYDVDPPHLMLRYVNATSGTEFRLRAWQPVEGSATQGATELGTEEPEGSVGWQRPELNWPYLIASFLVQYPLMIVLPLLAGWQLVRREWATWGVFWAGALTFVVSQVVHLPLNWLMGLLGPIAKGVSLWPLPWLALVAGLSAGLCETLARWVALRWAMRRTRGFQNAVQFGLGHGAVEAVLLGLIALSGTINILALWRSDPATLGLSQAQQQQMVAAFAELRQVAWYMPVLSGLERVFALCLHVAMSVLVMDGIMRQRPLNVLWAVLAHAAVDAYAVWSINTLGAVWSEVGLAVAAALCVAYVLRMARHFGVTPPPERAEF